MCAVVKSRRKRGRGQVPPELSNVLTHNDLKYHICPATQKTQKKKKTQLNEFMLHFQLFTPSSSTILYIKSMGPT